MRDPEAVATALGITPAAIESRLEALALDAGSRAALAAAAEPAAENSSSFLHYLYRRLRDTPDVAALIASEAQVERLKGHQRGYLQDLFRAEIDWGYVLRRLWIGVVHHRVRLPPQWYLATYSHFICEHLDLLARTAPTPATAYEQTIALVKTVFFDASLVLDSYGRSEAAAVWISSHPAPDDKAPSGVGAPGRPSPPPPAAPAGPPSYARIRLTSEKTLERRRFIGISDRDVELLGSLRELVVGATPAILQEFYAYFSQSPGTAALMQPDTVNRLKRQVASYWSELVGSSFDRPYAASRMRIGVIHEKIGLDAQWYLAGLARQLVAFLRVIVARLPAPIDAIRALVRAVFFDLSFVLDAYMEARADSLLRNEGYANQLVAGLLSAVAVVDRGDRLVSANPTLVSLSGGDPSVLYLMPIQSVLPIPEVARMLVEARQPGSPRAVGVGRLGGRTLRIAASALAGQPATEGAVALVIDDVTDLLRLGDDLQRQTDGFAQLADAVGSVLWEMDPDTRTITAINGAAQALTGLRDLHFLGRPGAWIERIEEADRALFLERIAALEAGAPVDIEYRMRRADGAPLWVRSRVARSAASGDGRLIGSTADITAARRSAELRREALVRVAGGVAHIVNNSLMGVLGNIELHADDHGGLDQAPLLLEAIAAARKATSMGAQLRAFAGGQPLRPVVLSLSDETRAALPRLQALLGPAIRIRLELAGDLWPCRVDRGLLVTAMECLADNARLASDGRGEVVITARNCAAPGLDEASPGAGQGWVEWRLSDAGVGMTEQVRARAIEPFFTTRSLAEAAGLGLSMVHGFVTQSGGRLEITSQVGAGTTVILRWPGVRPDELAGPVDAAARPSPRVLVVEDDAQVRQVTTALIRRLGYRVWDTGSVDEAYRLAAAAPPDILLADLVLGQGTDGATLAAELLARRPGLSVILTSGYPAAQFDLRALPAGTQFLAKPFSFAALRRCLTATAPGLPGREDEVL